MLIITSFSEQFLLLNSFFFSLYTLNNDGKWRCSHFGFKSRWTKTSELSAILIQEPFHFPLQSDCPFYSQQVQVMGHCILTVGIFPSLFLSFFNARLTTFRTDFQSCFHSQFYYSFTAFFINYKSHYYNDFDTNFTTF